MKNYKRLSPFKFFCLQSFPFIEYDFDALTEYELICKVAEHLKKVTTRTNENTEDIKNLINWIDNLDLQDEVNNKLNDMAESGELARIINQEIFDELNRVVQHDTLILNDECKIYFPYRGQNAGDCSVIQTNNKTIIIDVGVSGNALISWLVTKGITKIDYVILSHYHQDHVGGNGSIGVIQLLNSNAIDTSECIFYLPHKGLDYSEIIESDKTEIMQNESAVKNEITAKGLTYVEPDNLDLLVLSEICYIKFINIGSNYYNNYYGLANNEYNNCSMVCELKHNNRYSLFTGDICEVAQGNLASLINQPDIVKAPHHDLESRGNTSFLKKMTAKIMMFFEWFDYENLEGLVTQFDQIIKNNQGNIYDTNNSQDVEILLKNDSIIENSSNGVYTLQNTSILTAQGIHLANNTDLNDVKEFGTYFTENYLETRSLLNTPQKIWSDSPYNYDMGRCRLEVIGMNFNLNIIVQRFITAIGTYKRIFNDSKWSDWSAESGGNLFELSMSIIPNNSDLNNYFEIGKYAIKDGTSYNTISNTPYGEGNQGGTMLFVLRLRTVEDIRTQILICATGNIYIRHANMDEYSTNVTSWSNWKKLDSTEIVSD